MSERVVPLRTLLQTAVIWFVLDCADILWMHWFDLTPETAFHLGYHGLALSFAAYFVAGRKVAS